MIGTSLAHYRITAKLGEGGMGEVYRATDTKLQREVAIKVLPAAFSEDHDRLARFEREAHLLAQLHHPHIASIFGIEHSEGVHALVMELVEGPTLAEHLGGRALPAGEAMELARQIAEALEAAHAKGIVHRDLKPQNVKLTGDGVVKVLDFGLAKAMQGPDASRSTPSHLAHSPTLTVAGTVEGVLLGTAAYMAPEQARGLAVDERADVWSFGVVLYEMLTGIQPFVADTVPDTLARVLMRDVDLSTLPPSTPRGLRELLRRCLAKAPRQRLHAIADVRIALEELLSGTPAESDVPAQPTTPPLARRSWRPWVGGLLAGAALAGLTIMAFGGGLSSTRPQPNASAAPMTLRTLVAAGEPADPTVSRDGRTLAFTATRGDDTQVWIKDLRSGSESPLGPSPSWAPRFSPDGTSLLYVARGERHGDLYRMALVTRESRLVARDAIWGDWSPDGRSVVLERPRPAENLAEALVLVDLESGHERTLSEEEHQFLQGPQFSPSGARIAASVTGQNSGVGDVIRVLEIASGAHRDHPLMLPGLGSLRALAHAWVSESRLVLMVRDVGGSFATGSSLVTLDLDSDRLENLLPLPSTGFGMSVSGPGSLVVSVGSSAQELVEFRRGADRAWREKVALTEGPFHDRQPVYSPDGKWIVFTSDRSGNLDLWRLSRETGELQRLTDNPADDWDPAISPDGTKVIFGSNRTGRYEIWLAEADGSAPRQVTDVANAQNPTMTSDGAWIVFSIEETGLAASGIWKIHPDGTASTRVLEGHYFHPDVSPDGGYVAFMATGTFELGVARLADGKRIPVSLPKSDRYRWSVEDRTYLWAKSEAHGSYGIVRLPFDPASESFGAPQLVIPAPDEPPESLGVARDGSALTSSTVANIQGALLRVDGLGDLAHR